jgi:hypothetical protein
MSMRQVYTVDVKKMRGDAFTFRRVLGLIQQELTQVLFNNIPIRNRPTSAYPNQNYV